MQTIRMVHGFTLYVQYKQYRTIILPTNTGHLNILFDIIKSNEYYCDSPLLFHLFVQQKRLKTAETN
jgi:hypothetical protein